MKYFLLLLAVSLSFLCRVTSQETRYPVTNYSTREYGRDFHPTNMAIVQDSRGLIYAANGFKLLEFDGSDWKSYPINKEKWILSLAVDSSGVIYAGSQNEFGLFEADRNGMLTYRSLSDSLEPEDFDFSNIWKVHAFSGGVIFQAEEKLFIYKDGRTVAINPETTFHTSFVANNRFFIRQRDIGLMEWKDNSLVKIKGGELFDTTGIFLMVPYGRDNNKIVTGTREKGFWLFDPAADSDTFQPFAIEDPGLLQESVITGGALTGDGSIAVSTMLNGVIVIDNEGHIKDIINSTTGLADNDVKQVITDQSNNLWLALNNGISRIEISSPLSFLTEESGITGSINALVRYKNLLYGGTTTGLIVQTSAKDVSFSPAFNISVPVWSLVSAGGSLIAGTDEGLFSILNNRITKIGDEISFALYFSPEMKLLFSGGPGGLTTYSYDGSFRKTNLLTVDGEDIIGIVGKRGKVDGEYELWLGTRYNGVIRIRIKNDFSGTTDVYNSTDGLPDGWVIPAALNSGVVFETIRGLYSFVDEDIVRATLPDSLKDKEEFIRGEFSPMSIGNERVGKSISFLKEIGNRVWICSDNKAGYLENGDSLVYVSKPFMGIDAGKINVIYPEENGISWIGTTDGLVKYDALTGKNYDLNFQTLIRKVGSIKTDSVVFAGTYRGTDNGGIGIVPEQPSEMITSLSYSDNSVRFEFSASFYEYPEGVAYSYKLEGQDSRWSQWTRENFQEYTNLQEGKYTFIVKARNIYGKESSPAEYSFVVLPPWYRSVAAYIAYALLALIFFWLFVRLYSYRLKRENIRLEGIVTERTAEVVRQKNEIEYKNVALEVSEEGD